MLLNRSGTAVPLLVIATLTAGLSARAQTPVRNPANGHYYLLVVLPTPISWQQASEAARNSSLHGMPGYLATITTEQENNFVRRRIYNAVARPSHYSIWLGGFKLPTSDTSPPKQGWRWVTGEPWKFTYWAKGEPNNAGGTEDRLIADGQRSCTWNDLRESAPGGPGHVDILAYVVEYGKVSLVPPRAGRRK